MSAEQRAPGNAFEQRDHRRTVQESPQPWKATWREVHAYASDESRIPPFEAITDPSRRMRLSREAGRRSPSSARQRRKLQCIER